MNKKYRSLISVLLLVFLLMMPVTVFADGKKAHPDRIKDQADILTTEEEQELRESADEISKRQKLDVVIVTVPNTGEKTAKEEAQDFYDYNGYGMGNNHDGIMLLLSMDDRQYYICTTGYGITAFTDSGINYIESQIVPEFKENDYVEAFVKFEKLSDDFVTAAKDGKPYDGKHMPVSSMAVMINVVESVILGFVVALFLALKKKAAMKTIREQDDACHYTCDEKVKLTKNHDRFVSEFVTKRIIEDEKKGSSTSTGSSGTTHGGGGGSF